MASTFGIQERLARIGSYPWWEVAVELGLIWVVVYIVVRFVQGTRAAGALKAVLVLFVVATLLARILGGAETFARLSYLYNQFLTVAVVGFIVIFQPELRRAVIRLGEASLFRSTPGQMQKVVEAVQAASGYLSKARFGALIVIERQSGLGVLAEGGTRIDAEVSSQLLQTIFYPGTALHDLAVVIRGTRVAAASVQLPLAEPADMPDPTFGARHRAAMGLSRECDALIVVVSEETGAIRVCEHGKLSSPLSPEQLGTELLSRLRESAREAEQAGTLAVEPAHEDATESEQAAKDEPGAATREAQRA
ncbi:MAG: diadenylate cyclase CdaA [Phycisphaerales bacterium]|nr:diadenylate cyclase CdaA [Phycisphaerales bacterium]